VTKYYSTKENKEMYSIEIPKEINIKIYKLKDTTIEKYCIVL